MLASMSEIDRRADAPVVNWSELSVSGLLPTGTVTLLLADVEGSTRLWESQPTEMTAALARLNRVVSAVIAAHDGVRPVEQGEGDSFVAAFARASDALAAALEMQRAALAPIRLRIGVHTGEIQLRDEGNYAGPTINRTARLRDLGHGGQTLLSGATEAMVLDALPSDAWLSDLGSHVLRDLPRPERVMQLCHPDVDNDFPPLRTPKVVVSQHLPIQLTSFVGRQDQLTQVRELLTQNRLVTLTGAGGAGKTRLAIQIAGQLSGEFGDGIWYVDLAPITDPDVVPVAVARALGLPDQPGRSTMDTLLRFVRGRQTLVVLDNCEHLLDASAELVIALLGGSPGLTVLATSREPIGVAGEATWRVPSLSIADEAVELFADRARLAQTGFTVTDDCAALVAEICQRLDGMPLAIELAAARVRALSLLEILDSLHDRFRLLTGGARTAVAANKRCALRRLVARALDRNRTHAVSSAGGVLRRLRPRCRPDGRRRRCGGALSGARSTHPAGGQVTVGSRRLQGPNALPAAGDGASVCSREARGVRGGGHRAGSSPRLLHGAGCPARRAGRREVRAAPAAGRDRDRQFASRVRMSRENFDVEPALALASSLQPLWVTRGRLREGLVWFDAALADQTAQEAAVAAAVYARASRTRQSSMHGAPSTAACTRPNKPWRSRARSTSRPCWPGHWPPAALSPLRAITPRWPGHASPRRSAWPVQ